MTTVGRLVGWVKQAAENLKLPQFFAILFFCQKIVPAILSWHSAEPGRGPTVSLFGQPVPFPPALASPMVPDIVAVIVTVLIVGVLFLEDREKRWAKRTFFGFKEAQAVQFVLPATQPGGNPDMKISNRALEHSKEPGWESFRDAFESVLGTTDVKTFSLLAQKARAIDVDLGVRIDIDLVHPKRGNALRAKFEGTESVVSFGSPASNVLTKWICEQNMNDPILPRFSENSISLGSGAATSSATTLSWKAKMLDYAILARVTDSAILKKPIAFFVCAGVDQAGSLFTAHKLFDDWQTLLKATDGRDFVYVYKIDRANLKNDETYEQAQATVESAYIKAKSGIWELAPT
jgi:hypothetical protein